MVSDQDGATRVPRIVFGEGRIAELPAIVTSLGRTVLVVTGSRSLRTRPDWGALHVGLQRAGCTVADVAVPAEPAPAVVDDIVRRHTGRGLELVVGIGGGSAIDAAKAIGALLPRGASVMDHLEGVGRGVPYGGPSLPVIAIPTTAGTGSEVTRNAVLTVPGRSGFKKSFRDDALLPRVALVDPELASSCPPRVAAFAGMDALTQLLESYTSVQADPVSDSLAWSGLEAIRAGLVRVRGPDLEDARMARVAMARAALLSGIALTRAGLGIVHGLAQPLGARHAVSHGAACGTLLAAATAVNLRALTRQDLSHPALERYARVGRLLGGREDLASDDARVALLQSLSDLTERFELPRLRDFGIGKDDVPGIACAASLKSNPVDLEPADIEEILCARL